MKFWMVVWMSGQIGGVAGPLPYDAEECLARAAEANAQIQAQITTGLDVEGNPVTSEARTLRWECVSGPDRPVMGASTLPASAMENGRG